VTPSLLAWLALLLPPAGGLLGLAVLLGLCLLVDTRRYPHYQLQAWLSLRRRLTLVAGLSCLAGAAGLLR
jgi:predicted membrane-bound spermidine synthase